ncbi:outer membrane beta-barrel family protein [Larkinella soli]|uniref:outer membrane beta-barrel family protein n=1 Tax=Larkinella soli TaxID=1770527 RepID=UPI000FFC0FEC|nr:outer membrane beta-barrel family protein [Larkinella soli]
MRPAFVCFLLLICSFSAFAQLSSNRLNGMVSDALNEPLPGAAVRLLRASDSTLVRAVLTGGNGKFGFTNLPADAYRVQVTSVGSNEYRSGTILIDGRARTVTLPVFIMTPSKTLLNEVKVVAKKPLLEQELDRTIVNVEAMIGSAGSNTLEVLERTPGVSVDGNGDISLNGQSGVLVLIDGRPTYMSGPDLAAYLRSLPGGSIDKIELMTNPPARYDAAGTSVINIRLKRARTQGYTGDIAFSYNRGVTSRSNDVVNLNYHHKKINLFGSLGYSKDGNYAEDRYERRVYDSTANLTSTIGLTNRYRSGSQGGMARLGMDYTVSPATTVGMVLLIQRRPRWERLDSDSRRFDGPLGPDSVGNGSTDGRFRWSSISANGNLQHKFGKTGREVSADLNFAKYTTRGEQRLRNQIEGPDGTLPAVDRFLHKLPSTIAIYSAKVDYIHPLVNLGKLEAGLKSSRVLNANNAQYFDLDGSLLLPDYGKSNHFRYLETILSAYANVRKDGKRLAAQGGLRLESTHLHGRQLGNPEIAETSFRRSFRSLFPSVFLGYKLDGAGRNTLTAGISRRISRPNYQLLNPFLAFRDPYSFTTGNPSLKPQYRWQYELKYQHKQVIGIALQYNRFRDIIFQLTEAVGDVFIHRPENVAKGYILALNTNGSVAPAKWWNVNATVMLARMALQGTAFSQPLNPGLFHARMSLLNQFRFGSGWSGEMSGYFSSRDLAGQTITEPRYRVAGALQKKLFHEKGSIRLTLDDLFHSWKAYDRTISLKRTEAVHRNVSDTRRIGLAFTYRFGKETFKRKRNHPDNATDEEKGRVD